ncbi:MAG: laccase domain-containing protein, partial [Oscillospiraceae bacterium]|nr:laccase domain-containing protein [Oscillospiraceae bacterium]
MFETRYNPEYLSSDVLSEGVVHCFSTRNGGVSKGYLESLNLGVHRGDDWDNVYENYRRLGAAVGFIPEQTVFTRQTHTDIVARVGAKDRGFGLFREVEPERDGICTNEPGVALVCFSADCTPILLHDPIRRAAAAVHAGWRGTAKGIVARCV